MSVWNFWAREARGNTHEFLVRARDKGEALRLGLLKIRDRCESEVLDWQVTPKALRIGA